MLSQRAFAVVLGVSSVCKGIEVAWQLGHGPRLGLPLLAAGLLTFLRPRSGAAGSAAAIAWLFANGVISNHTTLLFWAALTVAFFDEDAQQRLVLRCQLSILYGFATVAKLWPTWLSGEVLAVNTWIGPYLSRPLLMALAWGTILVESTLAVAVWGKRSVWLWLAVVTHVLILALSIRSLATSLVQLTLFNGLAVAMWLRVRSPASIRDTASAPASFTGA